MYFSYEFQINLKHDDKAIIIFNLTQFVVIKSKLLKHFKGTRVGAYCIIYIKPMLIEYVQCNNY